MAGKAQIIGQTAGTGVDRGGKYLTFSLGREEYGIGILKIREIIGMMPVTSVPQAPRYVKGVVNLRGKVVPILDLRLRFGMEEAAHTEMTCIIVVEIEVGGENRVAVGIVVDSVSEVLNIKGEDIEDSPVFGNVSVNTSYILGMAKINGGVKILLDIDRILGAEELAMMMKIS
jgi:purine-binding chemotaxis protein CheW